MKAPGRRPKLNDAQRAALVEIVESGPIPAIHGVVRWRLPVISADAPSARAMIVPGQTGMLCAPGNIGNYVDAALRLIGSPGDRRAISDAARQASTAYSWNATLDAAIDVYREVLGDRVDLRFADASAAYSFDVAQR